MGIIKEVTIQKNDVGASLNGEVLNKDKHTKHKILYIKKFQVLN